MPPKRQKGISNNSSAPARHNSGWWDEINSSSKMNMSTSAFGTSSGRKRGKVSQLDSDQNGKFTGATPSADVEEDDEPLIIINANSPPIWSIGSLVVYIIIFICEIAQNGGFAPMAINPLGGPTETTLILMGAKYGPRVVGGEWYRFIFSLFLHSGVFHLILVAILIFFTKEVERYSGFWRAFSVYFLSGVFGAVLSCLFLPLAVSAGASGALLGYLGMLLTDLISTWRGQEDRVKKCSIYVGCIIVTICIGFTPYVDNFENFGGLITGFAFSLMLLPNMALGERAQFIRGIISFLSFPFYSLIFSICTVLIFRSIDSASSWCSFCYYINCINISGWCPPIVESQQVTKYIQ